MASLASVVLLCFVCEAVESNGPFKHSKVHVLITNTLLGVPTLTVHCKSKNDGLGCHLLGPGGYWSFVFRPDVLIKTLFSAALIGQANFTSLMFMYILEMMTNANTIVYGASYGMDCVYSISMMANTTYTILGIHRHQDSLYQDPPHRGLLVEKF